MNPTFSFFLSVRSWDWLFPTSVREHISLTLVFLACFAWFGGCLSLRRAASEPQASEDSSTSVSTIKLFPNFNISFFMFPSSKKQHPTTKNTPFDFGPHPFPPSFFFFWLWISLTTLGENPCLRTYGLTNIISKTKKQKKLQTNSEPSPRTLMLFLSHCTFTFFFLFTFVVSDCNTTKYQPVLCSVLLSVGFIFLLVGLVAIF